MGTTGGSKRRAADVSAEYRHGRAGAGHEHRDVESAESVAAAGSSAGSSGATANGTGAAAGSSQAAPGTGGAGMAAADAGVSSATDGPTFSSDECRWEGYGIGPLGAGQCNTQHLMVHSWLECSVSGGVANGQRSIVDQCTAEQADEVQTLCCFQGGVPPAEGTPVGSLYGAVELVTVADAVANRGAFLSGAAARCSQQGLRLGDWSMLYAPDGTTPQVLRVGCH
jgi:hypothetical protein